MLNKQIFYCFYGYQNLLYISLMNYLIYYKFMLLEYYFLYNSSVDKYLFSYHSRRSSYLNNQEN